MHRIILLKIIYITVNTQSIAMFHTPCLKLITNKFMGDNMHQQDKQYLYNKLN